MTGLGFRTLLGSIRTAALSWTKETSFTYRSTSALGAIAEKSLPFTHSSKPCERDIVRGAQLPLSTGTLKRNGKVATDILDRLDGVARDANVSSPNGCSQLAPSPGKVVTGQMLDSARDLRTARPGDVIMPPYELTVSEAMHDFWQSAFHAQDRISTSTPFARKIGLQDRIMPFSLVLFLTSSMTHADAAKVQVGFDNAIYHFPAFQGDTFTKRFQVKSVRNTSDGHHTVIHFTCELINQRGRVCMSADKRMMFEFSVPESLVETRDNNEDAHASQLFRDHLLSKSKVLKELGSHSLKRLKPGQLILHRMARSVTMSQSQQLASLARLTHERHFDTRKYDPASEILVPGGVVLGLAMSASSRDLHEVLHEEIMNVSYVNAVHPGNVVGAITYVQSVDDNAPGDLEVLRVKTVGVKNMDVSRELEKVPLPMELFTGDEHIRTKDVERVCKEKCPMLSKKIVVHMDRRIIRQAIHKEVFLL